VLSCLYDARCGANCAIRGRIVANLQQPANEASLGPPIASSTSTAGIATIQQELSLETRTARLKPMVDS
jgi:hypothetical protein